MAGILRRSCEPRLRVALSRFCRTYDRLSLVLPFFLINELVGLSASNLFRSSMSSVTYTHNDLTSILQLRTRPPLVPLTRDRGAANSLFSYSSKSSHPGGGRAGSPQAVRLFSSDVLEYRRNGHPAA